MNILDNFYIKNNIVYLNKYKLIIRDYKTLEKLEYTDSVYYVNENSMRQWTEHLIPDHQLLELISQEELDTSEYTWMEGIILRSDNHTKEIEEIASYGSKEAYEASLPETRDLYQVDMDYRLSKLELGI
ncbi:MAG: hypothetical protein HFE52_07710 [Clostridia bacterium]|nr:hypothetical protein [Clostridia bacterium]